MRSLSFARQFNFTGQPGLSVPTGLSPSGLPVGVQLVGPPAGEALLLQLGRQLEDALPWRSAWPRGMQAGNGER
jgi:amidase